MTNAMPSYHTDRPHPHPGGCEGCRAEQACNVCGGDVASQHQRCTNGRCLDCHGKHCSRGGEAGHGYGTIGGVP